MRAVHIQWTTKKEEAIPGQMQVPDFMTSAFKSLMTLRMGSLGTGSDSDGKLATTVAAPLHCEMPVSLAASKQ